MKTYISSSERPLVSGYAYHVTGKMRAPSVEREEAKKAMRNGRAQCDEGVAGLLMTAKMMYVW